MSDNQSAGNGYDGFYFIIGGTLVAVVILSAAFLTGGMGDQEALRSISVKSPYIGSAPATHIGKR